MHIIQSIAAHKILYCILTSVFLQQKNLQRFGWSDLKQAVGAYIARDKNSIHNILNT